MWATRRSIEPGLEGVVASVNLNRGGVPKPPVDGTWVRTLGLAGDAHHNPDVHGGPTAAVCLYPQEAIERVRADGHQSFPGSYGENLTLLGIDWSRLGDGDRLELGDPDGDETDGTLGPLLELTQYATPCATQAPWFVEGRIARISHKVRPEDARWYARVLREGPGPAGHGRPGAARGLIAARPPRRRNRDARGRPLGHRVRERHALRFAPMHAGSDGQDRTRRPGEGPRDPRHAPRAARRRARAAQRRRARQPRVGGGLRGGGPDRDRDRPDRTGDGPAQGLRGDRRQHPRRDPVRDPPGPPSRRSKPCCYRSADGRGRARAEPELRAAERLQHPAGVPARVRLEGRGHRVRPRRPSGRSAQASTRRR